MELLKPRLLLPCLLLGLLFSRAITAQEDTLPERLNGYDPKDLIRFHDLSGAVSRRAQLNQFIWPAGLPETVPVVTPVTDPPELAVLQADLIGRIDRLDISVGEFDFQAIAFRLFPKQPASPSVSVIVHQGHAPNGPEHYLEAGLDDTIEHLLKRGCTVVMMQMPLVGWNQDHTGKLPDGTGFDVDARGTRGHNELFEQLAPTLQGRAFTFFLEPVVQVVNLLAADSTPPARIGMIGLSGGGWTTHMSAAVDVRIQFSVPVAGAMPLYAREFNRSGGDAEQEYTPLYREIDRSGDGIAETADGVASWLEVFALGGIGSAEQLRRQVQVLNFYDSCCFNGPVYQTYDAFLTRHVAGVHAGSWELFVDRSHKGHVISQLTLTSVLDQLLKP